MKNKKIETIRVNEKLAQFLEDVPKGISYADWLNNKIERLEAHELNPVCWVVSELNIGPNTMSNGDSNGTQPVFDEIFSISLECPRTNMSGEPRPEGWLGSSNNMSEHAHGGFASINAARSYIEQYLGGRLIKDEELLRDNYDDEDEDIYTSSEFDHYYMVDEFMSIDEPAVKGLTDEEIEKLAHSLLLDANNEGYGICGDIEQYLLELRNSL